jgi:hypothetical protein
LIFEIILLIIFTIFLGNQNPGPGNHLSLKEPNYKKELRFIKEMAVKNGFNLSTIY